MHPPRSRGKLFCSIAIRAFNLPGRQAESIAYAYAMSPVVKSVDLMGVEPITPILQGSVASIGMQAPVFLVDFDGSLVPRYHPCRRIATMDFIDFYSLWIGHAGDGRDAKSICEFGIEAVLQLATEEPIPHLPRDILQFRIPILDGEGNDLNRLRLAVNLLSELLKSQIPTLVCCSAGASRSPAIAAVAIAQSERRSPWESLMFIREHHSIDVSPGLWNELLSCYPEVE